MKKKDIILIGIGLAAFLGYRYFSSLDKIRFEIGAFKIKSFTPNYTKGEITISFINPTSKKFTFSKLFSVLSFNESILSTFKKEIPIDIPPRKITNVSVPLQINNLNVTNEFLEYLKSGRLHNLDFTGTMNIDNTSYPIRKEIKIL